MSFIFFSFLQTHLPITRSPNKASFFILFLFLFFTFLQTHLLIIYFPANSSTHYTCSSRIYQTKNFFFFNFSANPSTHHASLSTQLPNKVSSSSFPHPWYESWRRRHEHSGGPRRGCGGHRRRGSESCTC